jgi:prephenate dehydrogenase
VTRRGARCQVWRLVDIVFDQLDVAIDAALVVDLTSLIQSMSRTMSPVSRRLRALLISGHPLPDQAFIDPSTEVSEV